MHPNAFLSSLWRSETLDQVFVAMSFDSRFVDRFENVIRPAIEEQPIGRKKLRAYRIDNSKTGDSILTDIIYNIAHSRIVLADVSVIDEGRYTELPIRNGNVMYEVGVALACRMPSEVLVVRDDNKKFLFDVSSIPHLTIDFSDQETAIDTLRAALNDRIIETDLSMDARVAIAVRQLTQNEMRVFHNLSLLKPDEALDLAISYSDRKLLSLPDQYGVSGLLRKGCIQSVAVNSKFGSVYYAMTPFGYAVAKAAKKQLKPTAPTRTKADKSDKYRNP